jgi:hypothetical protein
MMPRREPAAAFQYVLEHAEFSNTSAKSDNTSTFSDTLTTWPVCLNRVEKPPAVAGLVVNALPAVLLAEGYLRVLRPRQDKWE